MVAADCGTCEMDTQSCRDQEKKLPKNIMLSKILRESLLNYFFNSSLKKQKFVISRKVNSFSGLSRISSEAVLPCMDCLRTAWSQLA